MSRTVEKALAHLAEEKSAILSADFQKLRLLADGTRDLAARAETDAELALALRAPAERNRALLKQALKGIESARQEARTNAKLRQTFGSYGQDGQVRQHVGPASKIQRSF